jgi:hypothetical protein
VDDAAIDWLIGQVLESLARNQPIAPAAVTFLLRRYVATGAEALSGALGSALAAALDGAADVEDPRARSEWLSLFVEAAAISEDGRLRDAAAALVSRLRSDWPARGKLEPAVRSVDACLSAASALPDLFNPRELVPAAIDELEHVVRVVYQPGDGLAHTLREPNGARGTLRDHVATASALLTAYAITGRLPYSMLAEELMQFAQRTNPEPGASDLERFVARSEAARVLCRLAKLHEDDEYRQVAVIAVSSDYADAAKRTLADLACTYADHGADAAIFGIALSERQGLR